MVLCPAMIHGSGLDLFRKELPEQIIDVGIAEEHAVVMASAMARADKNRLFVYIRPSYKGHMTKSAMMLREPIRMLSS